MKASQADRTHMIVHQHQVKGENTDYDLDVFDSNIFFGSVGQILERSIGSSILINGYHLGVHDKTVDLLDLEKVQNSVGGLRCI
jgi:hypothetical protein